MHGDAKRLTVLAPGDDLQQFALFGQRIGAWADGLVGHGVGRRLGLDGGGDFIDAASQQAAEQMTPAGGEAGSFLRRGGGVSRDVDG